MQKYACDGFRPISATSIDAAAEAFARRAARRRGRRYYVRTLNSNAWRQDGSYAEFSAFIGVDRVEFFDRRGRPSGQPSCVGRDEFLAISAIG